MRKFALSLLLALVLVVTYAILSTQKSEKFTVEGSRNLAIMPGNGVKRALLVATGRYLNKKIMPLKGVDPDVELIRERLLDPRCGFKDENVNVLKTEGYPTLENINEAVDNFLDSCGPNDFAFLYLAGHGVRDPGAKVDYYVPFDARPIIKKGKIKSFESSTCFSLKTLREKIERCDAKFKWVVVDACRTNLDARDGFDDDWNSIDKLEAAEGSLWFQSCGVGQKSYEIALSLDDKVVNHGMFTWYFCEGAEGAAANSAGQVSPIGLFKYVRSKMREAINKDRNFPKQEPLMSCQDLSDGEFVFVDLSDADKTRAKTAYDAALQHFLDREYKKAQTEINEAVKLDPDKTYLTLKERIDELVDVIDKSELPTDYLASNGAEYRLIKAGSFMMGSPLSGEEVVRKYPIDFSAIYFDAPQHKVTLTQDFYLAKYPVTRGEFKKFVDATGYKTTAEKEGPTYVLKNVEDCWKIVDYEGWKDPGFAQTDAHPVVCVSYEDAVAYIAWLNKNSKAEAELKGFKPTYRLPTEAEWEYACRAGTNTEFFWGDDEKGGKDYLNGTGVDEEHKYSFSFSDGYIEKTSPVGSFKANSWGLYDMLGNVLEWTSDWYGEYPEGSVTDPEGAGSCSARVLRGGGWRGYPASCRCACRGCDAPTEWYEDIGFRVAFSLIKQ